MPNAIASGRQIRRARCPSYWRGVLCIVVSPYTVFWCCKHKHASKQTAYICALDREKGSGPLTVQPEECRPRTISQAGTFSFEPREVAIICNDLGIEPGILTDNDITRWMEDTINHEFAHRYVE